MIFSEKKENNSFVYKTVDVFGEMEFSSPTKLKPELLDQIFLAIFNIKSNTETIEGEVAGTGISYKFKKAKQWDKLDEEEEVKDHREPVKPKRKMPSSLKRYWHRQDMAVASVAIIIGASIVAIAWLISLL
jgi:hypothetical protein